MLPRFDCDTERWRPRLSCTLRDFAPCSYLRKLKIILLLHQSESTRYDHERPNLSSRAARMFVCFAGRPHDLPMWQGIPIARTLRRCLEVLTHLADCLDRATILSRRKKKANVRRETSAVSGRRVTIVPNKNRIQMPPHLLSHQ